MDPMFNSEWSASEIRMAKSLITGHQANNNYAGDTNSKHDDIVNEIQSRFPLKAKRQVIKLYVELMVQMTQTAAHSNQSTVATNNLVTDNFEVPVEDSTTMDMLFAYLTDETPNAMRLVEEAPRQRQVMIPLQETRYKAGRFWTIEEHRQFLRGLCMHGRGKWKDISRDFVSTKTPVQISSHAQKYFRRQERATKKQRYSINDVGLYDAERPWVQNNNSSSLETLAFAGDSYNPNCNGSSSQLAAINNNLAQVFSPSLYRDGQASSNQVITWTGQHQMGASSGTLAPQGAGSQMAWTGDQQGYFQGQWMGKDNMYQ